MNAPPGSVDLLSVHEVAERLRGARFPWCIAGGWGIDLFLGIQTRAHEDTDVLILRRDQMALQRLLAGWDLHAADPPGTGALRPWRASEPLELPVHEVWARSAPHKAWQLEIALGEDDGDHWVYRRNSDVRRSIRTLGRVNADGIPYVVPEVLLLFKAKSSRPKDDQDFDAVLPELSSTGRRWLRDALTATYPGHRWLELL